MPTIVTIQGWDSSQGVGSDHPGGCVGQVILGCYDNYCDYAGLTLLTGCGMLCQLGSSTTSVHSNVGNVDTVKGCPVLFWALVWHNTGCHTLRVSGLYNSVTVVTVAGPA